MSPCQAGPRPAELSPQPSSNALLTDAVHYLLPCPGIAIPSDTAEVSQSSPNHSNYRGSAGRLSDAAPTTNSWGQLSISILMLLKEGTLMF